MSFKVKANIWVLKLTRNWIGLALVLVGTYATLPFVAPTLMKLGATGAANVLYTLYSPMCHQFAFRSIFLYGEQPFYPREISGSEYKSYEAYTANISDMPKITDLSDFSPEFWFPARYFQGNETMGYKTSLCARDAAIYLALFIGGVIYWKLRFRLRPMPFWLYIVFGLMPIGIDGFSQLLSYPPFGFWPVREALPFFRIATGIFFGLANAWLGFPHMDRSMLATRVELEAKLKRAGYDKV
ncbi:hypothetical protein MASR2M15_14000 [Anaerolineales bacterium]